MTPDEVALLDNRYGILFIRGERPVKDFKYDILKHPNVKYTEDGEGKPYNHGMGSEAIFTIALTGDAFKEDENTSKEIQESGYVLLSEEDVADEIKKHEGGIKDNEKEEKQSIRKTIS